MYMQSLCDKKTEIKQEKTVMNVLRGCCVQQEAIARAQMYTRFAKHLNGRICLMPLILKSEANDKFVTYNMTPLRLLFVVVNATLPLICLLI